MRYCGSKWILFLIGAIACQARAEVPHLGSLNDSEYARVPLTWGCDPVSQNVSYCDSLQNGEVLLFDDSEYHDGQPHGLVRVSSDDQSIGETCDGFPFPYGDHFFKITRAIENAHEPNILHYGLTVQERDAHLLEHSTHTKLESFYKKTRASRELDPMALDGYFSINSAHPENAILELHYGIDQAKKVHGKKFYFSCLTGEKYEVRRQQRINKCIEKFTKNPIGTFFFVFTLGAAAIPCFDL